MKVAIGTLLRSAAKPTMLTLGSIAVAAVLAGCGDKESDPDAVSLEDLKYPGALSIMDKGDGAVTLWWSGSNNEADFSGYNVYGMKGEPEAFGLTQGQSLQLSDAEGEPIQAARDTLAKFNYDPAAGKQLEVKGDAVNEDGEAEFSALPIHTLAADGTTRLVPTCKGQGDKCVATTEANKDFTPSTNSSYAVNGPISYDLTGLKVGDSYCFLILSTLSGGTEVSQTSSNFQCVTSNYVANFDLPLANASGDNTEFKVADLLAACVAGDCGDGATHFTDVNTAQANKDSEGVMYVEFGGAGNGPQWVAGKFSSVIDLGVATGFDDASLPDTAPTFVIDENNLISGGGYAVSGQSVAIREGHMYVIAQGDSAGAATQNAFNYHWLYVTAATDGASVAVEMRLAKTAK